jgi:hypothetical protein
VGAARQMRRVNSDRKRNFKHQMTWHEKIEAGKRRLPPWLWDGLMEQGRSMPCTCENKPDALCLRCISISERDFGESARKQ